MAKQATLFGIGVYDLMQASHILGIDERTLRNWSQSSAKGPALVSPTHGWAYSFHDVLSFAVIAVLRQRGVKPDGVRLTIRDLEARFGYSKPLAHEDVVDGIATVGASVVLVKEATDLTAGGQGVLLSTVESYIRRIEYGSDRLAKLWRPADHVLMHPDVQVGHPCIDSTRITTETIAGRARQGESVSLIADDLEVSVAEASAAIEFESQLDEGRGVALVA